MCYGRYANKLYYITQEIIGLQSVWDFLDIPIGSWETLFWSWTVETFSVVDTHREVTRKICQISLKQTLAHLYLTNILAKFL